MDIKDAAKKTLLLLLLFLGKEAIAQNPFGLYYEPEFEVEFSSAERWTHSFGIANRNSFFLYENGEKVASADQEHLELNHFTGYNLNSRAKISLGLRYRFREVFDDSRHNEFRIVEQFAYKHPDTYLNFGHRIRVEQRFRDDFIFRGRYRLSIARPLGEEYGVGLSTETIYSLSEGDKPAAEQRFTFEVENSSFENLELTGGLEYRLDNFNNSLEENIFILTGATLNLD